MVLQMYELDGYLFLQFKFVKSYEFGVVDFFVAVWW